MATHKRRNFKKMKSDQQQRFIKAVLWMKGHTKTGVVSATGGSYQKYVDWHASMARVAYKDLFDFETTTTGTLRATDRLISIHIDGKELKPKSRAPIKMTNKAALEDFLNGLYAQGVNSVFPGSASGIGGFSVSLSAGKAKITCTRGVYEPQKMRCQISGTAKNFTFTKSAKVGDLEISNMDVAHFGPLFLPWHRAFIRLFELDLQTADEQRLQIDLGDTAKKDKFIKKNGVIALPYWDWTVDNSKDPRSLKGYLWQDTLMGGDGETINPPIAMNRLQTGPFKHTDWELFGSRSDHLKRTIGRTPDNDKLASLSDVKFANKRKVYDVFPYDIFTSDKSFRNVLEGWADVPGNAKLDRLNNELHNGVHNWVGGTMADVTFSPNDPVFFLHHCNVDRLWSRWQRTHKKTSQYPKFGPIPGRRKKDDMLPWVTGSSPGAIRAADVLRHRKFPSGITTILGTGYKYI